MWRGRRVLVTGGTGLLGGWVVRALLGRGAGVIALVRDGVPEAELYKGDMARHVVTVRGDVTDLAVVERVLAEYEVQTVLHLAAQTIVPIALREPLGTLETNIRGTWVVLEACRRQRTVRQLVVTSSDKAYGDQGRRPYDESMSLAGKHPYDVSKACADLLAQAWATTYGLPVAVTRCGNLFGGGDLNWNRLVPGTIRSLLERKPPVLRSDGSPVRDFVYAEDGAEAVLALAEGLEGRPELAGRVFNVSAERPISVLEMVETIIEVVGVEIRPVIGPGIGAEIPYQALNATAARRELNWRPVVGLREGLGRTVSWYRQALHDRLLLANGG